jgi:hypothetical protein
MVLKMFLKGLSLSLFLVAGTDFPTHDLHAGVCGGGGGEPTTEVAVPRVGSGISPLDPTPDLEVGVNNFDIDGVGTFGPYPPGTTIEFHSGFGRQFVNFDGTASTFTHVISLYRRSGVDTILVDTDTVSVYLNQEAISTGYLCAFETFPNPGSYNRLILLQSVLEDATGDTLAQDRDWVTRTIAITSQ